jgi:flagellar hook-associated protein 3 FlgL
MRIPTAMIFDQAQATLQKRRAESARVQEAIATGRQINGLGDDPIGVRSVLRDESLLRTVESRRRTLGDAEGLLQQSDDALGAVSEVAQRVTELAVQLSNDTYSAADRQAAADELVHLRERLLELGNSESNGRYLFGGLGSGAPPFQSNGAFQGDGGRLEIPMGRGVRVEATLEGGRPFLDPAGGPSVFDTLSSLETALRADNGDAVRALLDEVRGHSDRVSDARQAIGDRFSRLDNVRGALDRAELTATASLEANRDTDLADAVVQLQKSETGLKAALSVTARLEELSLVNYVR